MKGELCVMDRSGDTKTIWDPNVPSEVDAARELFDTLKAKGHIAYRVIGDGSKGEIMKTFDPQAGKIIMAPPVAGG